MYTYTEDQIAAFKTIFKDDELLKPMYTEDQIAAFRIFIKDAGLSVPMVFDCLTDRELAAICNGWGPDSWPLILRKHLTGIAGYYEVLAIPHDIRFEFKDGSFRQANKEFWINARKLWFRKHGCKGIWRFRALKELILLFGCYIVLQTFGRSAWED